MELKNIYLLFDFLFTCISALAAIEIIPLLITWNSSLIFSEIDNGIKLIGAAVSCLYFGIRIYFYFHKSKAEILYLKQQTIDLELKNKNFEVNNLVFSSFIEYEKEKEKEKNLKEL